MPTRGRKTGTVKTTVAKFSVDEARQLKCVISGLKDLVVESCNFEIRCGSDDGSVPGNVVLSRCVLDVSVHLELSAEFFSSYECEQSCKFSVKMKFLETVMTLANNDSVIEMTYSTCPSHKNGILGINIIEDECIAKAVDIYCDEYEESVPYAERKGHLFAIMDFVQFQKVCNHLSKNGDFLEMTINKRSVKLMSGSQDGISGYYLYTLGPRGNKYIRSIEIGPEAPQEKVVTLAFARVCAVCRLASIAKFAKVVFSPDGPVTFHIEPHEVGSPEGMECRVTLATLVPTANGDDNGDDEDTAMVDESVDSWPGDQADVM